MDKNEYFGARREVSSRLEDFGYSDMAFAGGTQDNLTKAQADLTSAIADQLLNDQELADLKGSEVVYRNAYNDWDNQYKACKNSHCNWHNSSKTCNSCRQPKLEKLRYYSNQIKVVVGKMVSIKTKISSQQVIIDNLEEQVVALTEAINQEALAETTLAGQGLTSDSVLAQANADAQVLVSKANIEARKSKSRKIIILSIVLGAVLLTGIYVFFRIRKKIKK